MRLTSLVAAAIVVLATPDTLTAQAPDGWAFGAGGYVIHFTGDDTQTFSTLGGPAAQVSLLKPNGFGFDFRVGYIVPTGFYNMNGVSAILGGTYGWPVGGNHLVQAKAGVAGFLGGDSDGSVLNGAGPYAGGAITFRLGGRLGLPVEGLARTYTSSGNWFFAPSAAVSLLVLPR